MFSSTSPVSKSEGLVTTFLQVSSPAKNNFKPDATQISSNPSRSSSIPTICGADANIVDNKISTFSEVPPPVKLERTSLSKVIQPHDVDDIHDYGTLYDTNEQRKGVCGTKRSVNHAEPPVPKTVWGPTNEEPPNKKFKRYTTYKIRRREAATKKREATLQAQVEQDWAQVEQEQMSSIVPAGTVLSGCRSSL